MKRLIVALAILIAVALVGFAFVGLDSSSEEDSYGDCNYDSETLDLTCSPNLKIVTNYEYSSPGGAFYDSAPEFYDSNDVNLYELNLENFRKELDNCSACVPFENYSESQLMEFFHQPTQRVALFDGQRSYIFYLSKSGNYEINSSYIIENSDDLYNCNLYPELSPKMLVSERFGYETHARGSEARKGFGCFYLFDRLRFFKEKRVCDDLEDEELQEYCFEITS